MRHVDDVVDDVVLVVVDTKLLEVTTTGGR
jgi:hypothetical protein